MKKVRANDTIGYIFDEIIGNDWSHHLPVMYSFWEMVLLEKAGYMGNPVKKHVEIDSKIPLKKEHFDKWLELWNETTIELFDWPIAARAKDRAMLMANLISMKVEMAKDHKFIQ
jgi:hemoglobin